MEMCAPAGFRPGQTVDKVQGTLSMTYDKSIISNGVINIHATDSDGRSVKIDAYAKVNIYTAKYKHNIKFDVKRNNTKWSINYINSDYSFYLGYFLIDLDSRILNSLGMTVEDLGFHSFL